MRACDDGNADDRDACTNAARCARCGDGITRNDIEPSQVGYEECDDGNEVDGDGCSTACGLERCGNGRLDEGEACDDGNDVDADGCTSGCAEALRRRHLVPRRRRLR